MCFRHVYYKDDWRGENMKKELQSSKIKKYFFIQY